MCLVEYNYVECGKCHVGLVKAIDHVQWCGDARAAGVMCANARQEMRDFQDADNKQCSGDCMSEEARAERRREHRRQYNQRYRQDEGKKQARLEQNREYQKRKRALVVEKADELLARQQAAALRPLRPKGEESSEVPVAPAQNPPAAQSPAASQNRRPAGSPFAFFEPAANRPFTLNAPPPDQFPPAAQNPFFPPAGQNPPADPNRPPRGFGDANEQERRDHPDRPGYGGYY